jgi:hypothetical protein
MLLWCNTWNLNGVYISLGGGGGCWITVVVIFYLSFTMLHIQSKTWAIENLIARCLCDLPSTSEDELHELCMPCRCIIAPSESVYM